MGFNNVYLQKYLFSVNIWCTFDVHACVPSAFYAFPLERVYFVVVAYVQIDCLYGNLRASTIITWSYKLFLYSKAFLWTGNDKQLSQQIYFISDMIIFAINCHLVRKKILTLKFKYLVIFPYTCTCIELFFARR